MKNTPENFHKEFEKTSLRKEIELQNIQDIFLQHYNIKYNTKNSKFKNSIAKLIYRLKIFTIDFRHLKVVKYLNFELSNIKDGKVSNKVFTYRKNICMECPSNIKFDEKELGFCKSCGCGANPRARLDVKLTVAGAECPLNKWGREKASKKKTISNICESLLGICQTLWYNAKQLWQRN
jgi:rRNA maturation endonuclease Nob1